MPSIPIIARPLTPFVGREIELELLKEAHASTRAPGGSNPKRFVLITGEAGLGKTVLLREFGGYLRGRSEPLFEGWCYPGVDQAYQPFAEIITQALALQDQPIEESRALADFVPRLEPLLPSGRSSGATSKWQLYDAVLDFLRALGRLTPHTLFVHDLHYADPASLDLLRFLAENLTPDRALDRDGAEYPGLVVLSSREVEGARAAALGELARLPWVTGIRLGRLGKGDVAQLLQTSPVVERLHAHSGGNPHHLEELLLSLPSQVEDLFLERALRLSDEERACLGALATLTRPADAALVAQVADLGEDDAAVALDSLCAARIVTRSVDAARVCFTFEKELHRESYYGALDESDRTSLHRRAGEALQSLGEEHELLAFHFLRAHDPQRGPRHALAASRALARACAYGKAAELAEQATRCLQGDALRGALSELADLYRLQGLYPRALHALGRLIKSLPAQDRASPLRRAGQMLTLKGSYAAACRLLAKAEMLAVDANDAQERAQIRAALAEVYYLRGGYDEAEVLCRKELSGEVALSDSARVGLANILGKVLLQRERLDEALATFDGNLEQCQASGLLAERAAAHNNRGIVLMRRGQYEQAEDAYRAALSLFSDLHDPAGRAFCEQNIGVLCHERADYALALEAYHRGLAGFRRVGNKSQLTNTAINLGNLYLSLGDLDRAERLISFALDVARDLEMPLLTAYSHNLLGEILCAQGRWDAARVYLDQAQTLFDRVGSRRLVAEVRLNLARLWNAVGKVDKARSLLRKVEKVVFDEHLPKVAGQACLLRGDLALATGDLDRAEGFFEWALDLACADDDDEGRWRSHHGLGRVAARAERRVEAENHYLKARALLEALAARVPEDLREVYLAEATRHAVQAELEALSRGDRLPSTAPTAKRAAELFSAAASDLKQVRGQFGERRNGGAFSRIVGQSPRLNAALRIVEKVAPSTATVLLRGDSGTGKELVAEALHLASPRQSRPFIKVNCAALVETLLLSELFGHEKGAFTGALARKRGRFELADGGTLFLDEIGDISPKTQIALLRVLQERQFERVGGVTPIQVDVRIVCATNRDLEAMVRAGEFREDLYFRLKGVVVELPSLRERPEDVPLLATHFLEKASAENGDQPMIFDEEAMDLLMGYSWPGNIRELENVIRSAALFAEGRVVGRDAMAHLREFQQTEPAPARPISVSAAPSEAALVERVLSEEIGLAEMKKQLELRCIREALQRTGGNITQAAKLLQMKRPRLSQIVKEHGDLLRMEEGQST